MQIIRTPNALRDDLRRSADDHTGTAITQGERGAVIGHLNSVCKRDDHLRRLFLGFVFGEPGMEMSTKYLKDNEFAALFEWINATEDDGVWEPSMRFVLEAARVIAQLESVKI